MEKQRENRNRLSRRKQRAFCPAILAAALATITALTVVPVGAAPGDLDPSFGTGGILVDEFGGVDEGLETLVLQPDGKILAGGWGMITGLSSDYVIARYHSNGSADTSFGKGGKVITHLGDWDSVEKLLLQNDGRIIAVGTTSPSPSFSLARYHSNGALDSSFGNGGIVISPLGERNRAESALLLPNGKIVVAGSIQTNGRSGFGIARYHANGILDTSFGSSGWVKFQFDNTPDSNTTSQIECLLLRPDGKIIAAGEFHDTETSYKQIAIAQFTDTGIFDTSFGTGGKVITTFSLGATLSDALMQADGRIVITGAVRNVGNSAEILMIRYLADGSPDNSFGVSGIVQDDAQAYSSSILLQNDGKIVIGGGTTTNHFSELRSFFLARYHPSGAIDHAFGSSGYRTTTVDPTQNDDIRTMILDHNGAILVGGLTSYTLHTSRRSHSSVIARYEGSQKPGNDDDGGTVTSNLTLKKSILRKIRSVKKQIKKAKKKRNRRKLSKLNRKLRKLKKSLRTP